VAEQIALLTTSLDSIRAGTIAELRAHDDSTTLETPRTCPKIGVHLSRMTFLKQGHMFVLAVNKNLVPLRLGTVLVSVASFPYCEITISSVTGPTKVARGSVAE